MYRSVSEAGLEIACDTSVEPWVAAKRSYSVLDYYGWCRCVVVGRSQRSRCLSRFEVDDAIGQTTEDTNQKLGTLCERLPRKTQTDGGFRRRICRSKHSEVRTTQTSPRPPLPTTTTYLARS